MLSEVRLWWCSWRVPAGSLSSAGSGKEHRQPGPGSAGPGARAAGGTGARRRLPRYPRSRRCVRRPRGGAAGPGMRRRPGAASARRPFALAGDPWSSPTPLGAATLSSLFSSPQGIQGRQGTGWRDGSRLLASKPAHGTCSRVPFSGPAFVGAKYSHVLAARQGKTGDCNGVPCSELS